MIFYFSGTGNSEWAARKIASALNDKLLFIPDVMNSSCSYELARNERLGFVFPVYAWRVPSFIKEFIRRLKVSNVSYVYFVATCGDDSGRMKEDFISIAHAKGWEVACGYSLIMPEAYISLPGFDVDTKDKERAKLMQASHRLDEITEELIDMRKGTFDTHPGAFPWLKTAVLGAFFNTFLLSPKPFKSLDTCIGCGKCASVCPMHNISLVSNGQSSGKSVSHDDVHPQWGRECVGCLKCYHSCPVNAVQYGRRTKGKGQYLHPDLRRK